LLTKAVDFVDSVAIAISANFRKKRSGVQIDPHRRSRGLVFWRHSSVKSISSIS